MITLSNKERLTLIRNLGTMLEAGVPIIEAVGQLSEDYTGNSKKLLIELRDDLNQGKKISDTFSRNYKAFDPVTVNLISSSEESGNLSQTLKQLTVNLKKSIEFTERVKSALIYPMVIFVLFIGIMVVILTYVIPRISSVFSRMEVDLPLPTRILMAVSAFIMNNWIFVLAGSLLFVIVSVVLLITRKAEIVRFFSTLPGFSKLSTQIDLVRFTNSMYLLLSSGVPITRSLEYSEKVINNKKLSALIRNAAAEVMDGEKLSTGLENDQKLIPSVMTRIIKSGEETGTLYATMGEISEYFDEEVSYTLKNVTTLMEPVLLVIVGVSVGLIMISIIAPIYQLMGSIQPR